MIQPQFQLISDRRFSVMLPKFAYQLTDGVMTQSGQLFQRESVLNVFIDKIFNLNFIRVFRTVGGAIASFHRLCDDRKQQSEKTVKFQFIRELAGFCKLGIHFVKDLPGIILFLRIQLAANILFPR